METFETYGFTMSFDKKDNHKYLQLKDSIERLCRNTYRLYAQTNNNNIISHFVEIKKDVYITCCLLNNNVKFGIYFKNQQKIVQNINSDFSFEIKQKHIDVLEHRIENLINSSKYIKIVPLCDIWIERLKENKIDNDMCLNADEFYK